jgi:hydroxyacylglutathione hydrolase
MNRWITKNGIQIYQILGGRSNSYLISNSGKYLLIDTGPGSSWGRLSKRLGQMIPGNESLIALILTHVHYDHCENSARIKSLFGAKVIVHESESALLSNGKNSITRGAIPILRFLLNFVNGDKWLSKITYAPCGYDILVQGEYSLSDIHPKTFILPTPGHSIGSMSVIVNAEVAIVGDAMFGVFKNSIFPPWAKDTKQMVESWKLLLDTGCETFLPGHGTAVRRELLQKQYLLYKEKLLS